MVEEDYIVKSSQKISHFLHRCVKVFKAHLDYCFVVVHLAKLITPSFRRSVNTSFWEIHVVKLL